MKPVTDKRFEGRVAVVTGAGGKLCSAIAQDLAAAGAAVSLLGRTAATLEPGADAIHAGGRAQVVLTDVNDVEQVEAAFAETRAALGPCDMLLNGAGGNHIDALTTKTRCEPGDEAVEADEDLRTFFNLDLDRFESVLRTNTMGTVIPCRVFGREMVRDGRGTILNFASMNTYRPLTRVAAYAMSKAAIANFTQWLSVHLAPCGIRVNAVAPGFFVNERSRKYLMTEDGGLSPRGQQVMQHTPLERFGQPEDLFGCVRWLLDDRQSAFVTGLTVPVDGGFLASAGV